MTYSLEALKKKVKHIGLLYGIAISDMALLGGSMSVLRDELEDCDRVTILLPSEIYDRIKGRKEIKRNRLAGGFELMVSEKVDGAIFYRADERYVSGIQTETIEGLNCYTEESNTRHISICRKIAVAKKQQKLARV